LLAILAETSAPYFGLATSRFDRKFQHFRIRHARLLDKVCRCGHSRPDAPRGFQLFVFSFLQPRRQFRAA
jgi:hypothetical protein